MRRNDINDLFARRKLNGKEERCFLFVLLVFFLGSASDVTLVTVILNHDGVASSFVVSHFAVALTGKSGFRVHARCAIPRTGASRKIINCTCARALWAAELRKFSNCPRPNVYRNVPNAKYLCYIDMHTCIYSCNVRTFDELDLFFCSVFRNDSTIINT